MVNASSDPNQPIPGDAASQSKDCPPDCDLPENSPENLDARLDHAIEETFPTSDPISVTITKSAGAKAPREGDASTSDQRRADQGRAEQDTAEKLLDQVQEVIQDAAHTASGTIREAYREGQRYARQARERFPQAERFYRDGHETVGRHVEAAPLLSLLLAGAVGYALAWMIHGGQRGRDRRVPDYAKTRRSYAVHSAEHHEQ
ncbi:hypothetical protein [Microvirga sp. TS319]|uniref:hypothetical protein n=1 Tax=Microvirga sp. TS319 TaxID=3241165 RepID=UPI00351A1454